MNSTLYCVEVDSEFDSELYTVIAISRNDARLKAGRLFESYRGLAPARWEVGACGGWVRTTLLSATEDMPFDERTDGMLCKLGDTFKLSMV